MSVTAETSPMVAEFLRQVNALPPDDPGLVDLTSLWIFAGSPPDGRPDRWHEALAANDYKGPLASWSVVDGRAYGAGLLAFDYLMRLDRELYYLSYGFRSVMRHPQDVFVPFAANPTPSAAAVVIGVILGLREEWGLLDAVDAVRRGIDLYGKKSMDPAWEVETACARMSRALKGEPGLDEQPRPMLEPTR